MLVQPDRGLGTEQASAWSSSGGQRSMEPAHLRGPQQGRAGEEGEWYPILALALALAAGVALALVLALTLALTLDLNLDLALTLALHLVPALTDLVVDPIFVIAIHHGDEQLRPA